MLGWRLRRAVVGVLAVMSCILFLAAAQAQAAVSTLASWTFDNVSAPALPNGWATSGLNGGAWATASSSLNPPGVSPVSSANMLVFNSRAAAPTNFAYGYLTYNEDISHYINARVRFWMYHDSGASGSDDYVQVMYTTTSWVSASSAASIHRYSSSPGWQFHDIALPAGQTDNQATLSFGFAGNGVGGNDMFIDDVSLAAEFDPYCEPESGTTGTQIQIVSSGFGAKKGKVYLSEQKTPLKVITWGDTSITCEVSGVYPPGVYDVNVLPAEPKGAAPIVFTSAFTVAKPVIDTIDLPGGPPGTLITVNGDYFAAKKGKILLTGSGPKGLFSKSCKVAGWTMDPATGVSIAQFAIPAVPSGVYDLTLQVKGMPDTTLDDVITVP